ncbi:MAG: hypothetical protein ACT4OM_00095 [Actinomycetota bacterium]
MDEVNQPGSYRLRIRSGHYEVEVQGPDPNYVDAKFAELLALVDDEEPISDAATPPPRAEAESLGELIRLVGPSGGLEHALVAGYFLEKSAGLTGGFRRRDLAAAFKTIKYSHSNPGVPISLGKKQGLLVHASEPDRVKLSDAAAEWVRVRLGGE